MVIEPTRGACDVRNLLAPRARYLSKQMGKLALGASLAAPVKASPGGANGALRGEAFVHLSRPCPRRPKTPAKRKRRRPITSLLSPWLERRGRPADETAAPAAAT